MSDLARLRTDLAGFAAAIGLPLTPWQIGALALEYRNSRSRYAG